MTASVILWSNALAALLFAGLALSQLRSAGQTLPRRAFLSALVATALWCLAIAGIGPVDIVCRLLESMRNAAWLGFMFALIRRNPDVPARRAVAGMYGVVLAVILAGVVLAVIDEAVGHDTLETLIMARLILRAMVAIGALLLVHHLYAVVAPAARGGVRLVVVALAAMWSVDLLLAATSYLHHPLPLQLLAVRGVTMASLAPLFALAVQRGGDWQLQVSRTIAWQSLALGGLTLYGLAMACATSVLATLGGSHAQLWQTAFIFGTTTASLTLLSSTWLRAWLKVKLAKHLFRHRYDYRAEWLRFTATLGAPESGAAPLSERVVKALADLTDSPAGLLLVPAGTGMAAAAGWNWVPPMTDGGESLQRYLTDGDRIVEFDSVRAGTAPAAEAAAIPGWLLGGESWALVPLTHAGRLQGAIVLARPPIDRALDWEDFDLLRVAGQQAASYLAEARAQDALAQAARFDEFNRRFAFILHDIKNLVSQLTLVARNAERHADNPAFRADMIATLQDSAGRMNDLLARLSQHNTGRGEPPRAVALAPLGQRLAARWRSARPVTVRGDATAVADPVRLEQLLAHLIQNAIDASPAEAPVLLTFGHDYGAALAEVTDQGCGMSAAFIRDQLFQPFVSTKAGGFGIGAFEARQLAEAMDGTLTVTSREGVGTTVRVILPLASAPSMAAAPVLEHAA